MAIRMSNNLVNLAEDIVTQLSEKLIDSGRLIRVLNGHLAQTLPPEPGVKPEILALNIQVLAYEYAFHLASEFPKELVDGIRKVETELSAEYSKATEDAEILVSATKIPQGNEFSRPLQIYTKSRSDQIN